MKIAICGSLTFSKEMLGVQKELQELGHIVVVPKGAESYATGEEDVNDKWNERISDVIKEWYEEIKTSDAVLVVNKTKNNVENYIGGNGLIEIAFAHVLGKKIYLLNEIPEGMNYTDEIKAMKPIVLNGDVSKI